MKILPWYLTYAVGLSAALGLAGHRSRGASGQGTSNAKPRRLLVVGATGRTGRTLVSQALERGYEVTALARNLSAVTTQAPQLSWVEGDVTHADSLARAMAGQDAVVCALGHNRYYSSLRVLSRGTRHLIDAMRAQNVRRLVCVTSLGLGNSVGRLGLLYSLFVLPTALPFYFWDKCRQERAIADSGLDWVIVRPGRLTDAPASGKVRHGTRAGSYLLTRSVSRADVAAFMLDQLESDMYLHAAPGVVA